MKKILAFSLIAVVSCTLLTGCSDPVYDEFENFLNVEMKEVNANYTKITEEVAKWENFEDDTEIASSISDVILPLVEDSLERLDKTNPETDEVKDLKEKYVAVMDTYKEGFETFYEGCQTQEEETINSGTELLSKAVDQLNEYNAAVEKLAEEYGSEVEY